MKNTEGQLFEIYLDAGARIICPPEMIPTPGQYLLAHAHGSDSALAIPLFFSGSAPSGFRCAPLLDSSWNPGTRLNLRGPLGRGFLIPPSALKVALIVFDDSPARLRGLIRIALKQGAEVVLVCNSGLEDMPEAVEVQPLQSMFEAYRWADYAAFDLKRENLNEVKENFGKLEHSKAATLNVSKGPRATQILIRAPMPCGALAECGVCALTVRRNWKMICKDGPVFDMHELL